MRKKDIRNMKSIKKMVLVLTAATSITTTSIIPMNNYNVYAQESVQTKAFNLNEVYEWEVPAIRQIKYTGKELTNLPITGSYDFDGDGFISLDENKTLKLGADYKIVGYQNYRDEDNGLYLPEERMADRFWTKGCPVEAGTYFVLIEGAGECVGKSYIVIHISEVNNLYNFDIKFKDDYYKTADDVSLEYTYYDSESDSEVKKVLTSGKDFKVNGWCEGETYDKKVEKKKKITWTNKTISKSGYYYFNVKGLGEYSNQTYDFYEHVMAFSKKDLGCHKFDFGVKYNYLTGKYEYAMLSKGLVEGRDFSVVNFPNDERYDDILENVDDEGGSEIPKYAKAGYAKEKFSYMFAVGQGSFKGENGSVFENDKKLINVLKKANMTLAIDSLGTAKEHKEVYVAICPKKTKTYTITASGEYNTEFINAFGTLYDEAHNTLGSFDGRKTREKNNTIKVKLQAGRHYYMSISAEETDTYDLTHNVNGSSLKLSIDGAYSYRKPKVVADKKCKYAIIKSANAKGKKGEVAVIGAKKKTLKNIKIANTVKVNGKRYKVTFINVNAFKGNKKVKKIVMGKNVKSIGKNAFAKTSKKLVVKVPAKSKKTYTKLLKKSGFKGKIK